MDAKAGTARKPRVVGQARVAARAKPPPADGVPRGDARRRAILRALQGCVTSKGYSRTTLADVAEAAGMYPSHLLYYFNGKEAILGHYFQDVAERIVSRLESFRQERPELQIELLANLFFAGEGIKKAEIGVMLECFGVAVHDSVLRECKATLDRQGKEYLHELFQQSPGRTMDDARDCAEIAYAMLLGLRSAVYFDENLDLPDACRLFHSAVLRMAGYASVS